MKITVKEFRKILREAFVKILSEDEDRMRRHADKYGDDLEESIDVEEGVSQSKRSKAGYKGEDPVDYTDISEMQTRDPRLDPGSALRSAALHARDKSQMVPASGQRMGMDMAFKSLDGLPGQPLRKPQEGLSNVKRDVARI